MVKDVKMSYFEDDIEKIQAKPNLYIKSYGDDAEFHLAIEIIQNAIDECIDVNSPGQHIEIEYNEILNQITVNDDGRGFPEVDYPLDIFVTKIQSGSKFYRDQSGGTAGEFGLGGTACNALSSSFTVKNYRRKEKTIHTLVFRDGKKIKDETEKNPDKRSGATISFTPNPKYLGPCKLNVEEMQSWLNRISYLLPKERKIDIVFTVVNGFKTVLKEKYKSKDFADLLAEFYDEEDSVFKCKRVSFKASGTLKEEVQGSMVDKTVNLEVAYIYEGHAMTDIDSYCNFTNTTEGGVHVDAVDEILCRFFSAKTRASLTEKESEKIDILWNDVRAGLGLVVNLDTNAQVEFQGNAKEKIKNAALVPVIKEILTPLVKEYYEKNPDELTKVVKFIKLNAKARIEAAKVRSGIQKTSLGRFDEHKITKLRPCTSRNPEECEIFIVEGDSAASCAAQAADRRYQAVFALRGVTKNPLKVTLADLMSANGGNKEWQEYISVIGTGVGPDFNMKKLRFNKIIIMTDADIDGYGICEGVALLHMATVPDLVKEGKLYRVLPPLYKLKEKGSKDPIYVRNQDEISELYTKKLSKKIRIYLHDSKEPLSKNEMREFISDTSNYQEDLIRIAKHSGVNKLFLEKILSFIVQADADYLNPEKFEYLLTKQEYTAKMAAYLSKFYKKNEVFWAENDKSGRIISASVDGRTQSLRLTGKLIKGAYYILNVIHAYGDIIQISDNGEEPRKMSIGEFLDYSMRYLPAKVTRYKGVGEMQPDDLWETTMNPDTRVLIQLTSDDIKRDMEIFYKLNGNRQKDKQARKQMMMNYKIRREDIDN